MFNKKNLKHSIEFMTSCFLCICIVLSSMINVVHAENKSVKFATYTPVGVNADPVNIQDFDHVDPIAVDIGEMDIPAPTEVCYLEEEYIEEVDDNIEEIETDYSDNTSSNADSDIADSTSDSVYDSVPTEDEDETSSEANNENESEDAYYEETVSEYRYGKRVTPAVNINIPTGDDVRNYTGDVDTSNYEYIGNYKITGYTPKCAHCCGNTEGITASGVEAIPGYTVAAASNLPFGTTLYIEGYGYYVVEDRGGFGGNVIDIAAPNHEACYPITNNSVNVYIVS